MHIGTARFARFVHESEDVKLRLQVFLLARDASGRVATVRVEEWPDAWLLPGENLLLGEDPADGAARVAAGYFDSPVGEPRLLSVESFPPEDDGRWYLVFVYEADAPADLQGTPDTLELRFSEPGDPPGPFGFDHATMWERVVQG